MGPMLQKVCAAASLLLSSCPLWLYQRSLVDIHVVVASSLSELRLDSYDFLVYNHSNLNTILHSYFDFGLPSLAYLGSSAGYYSFVLLDSSSFELWSLRSVPQWIRLLQRSSNSRLFWLMTLLDRRAQMLRDLIWVLYIWLAIEVVKYRALPASGRVTVCMIAWWPLTLISSADYLTFSETSWCSCYCVQAVYCVSFFGHGF